MSDESWRERALCQEVGTELFFPTDGEPSAPAKAICKQCPVEGECLWFAMETGDNDFGVLGGLTAAERRRLARKLRAA